MTERRQALMIGHGALVLLIGLLAGYGYLFKLIGELQLWPIPGSISYELPADMGRWRAAHTGNIMNALMIIAIALCLPKLRLSDGEEKLVCWGLVLTIWGNVGFYVLSALGAPNRGLTFGANRFGEGGIFSIAAFLVGYPGALVAPIVMFVVARAAFRR